MPIQLVVGLGNPGSQYQGTRHNAGEDYVRALAERYSGQFKKEVRFHGLHCKIHVDHHPVQLLIPTTFMNRSGQAVAATSHYFKIPAEDILVAHDELDLPAGSVRLKTAGGHGGHNGLRDTIEKLSGAKQFHRLRLGIDHPGDKRQVANYVLSKAPLEQRQALQAAINESLGYSSAIIAGDHQAVMNQLHRFSAQ